MASSHASTRISFGRDASCAPEIASTMDAASRQGFDFVCVPLVHPRQKREALVEPGKSRAGPLTRSDLLLANQDWGSLVVGKLSPWLQPDSEVEYVRKNSEAALIQELNFTAYLSLPAVVIPLTQADNSNLAHILINHIQKGHHSQAFWMRVPLVSAADEVDEVVDDDDNNDGNGGKPGELNGPTEPQDTWAWWNSFRSLCDYNKRISLALELSVDLPSEEVIQKWLGEPIKAVVLHTSTFLTNKKGFPVLAQAHQLLVFRLFKLDVQFIITGMSCHSDKELRTYIQYLQHLSQHRPPPSNYDVFSKGYEDYLQCPLQPLMDNLESQTYEVFEKDPIKYSQYQRAVYMALLDKIPEEEKDSRVLVLMVLGAGRGPLVNSSLRAAKAAGRKIRVYAVEKNPNAVVTLENWKAEEWGDRVTVVSCDMREWLAPEKADIIVSELLGSFGDNELSPECLDGAQRFLSEDGISIPREYTSYISPISSSKLYNEVRACREKDKDPEAHFEMPYVVRLHNYHELAKPQPCFTFVHPNSEPGKDNSRYKALEFPISTDTVLHGFAGYFETVLYKDVTLSIHPETHSPGMFSWFPILFPIKHPMPVRSGDTVCLRFWRCCNQQKVWYEWAITSPMTSVLHNPAGRSSTIGL